MRAIALRYFDCRGRAEPIRQLLRDHGVTFEDAREPIADVRATIGKLSANPSLAAPFGLLPALDWDGFRVTQTLPIANFVSRELGLFAALDTRALARVESIASAAYSELTATLPELVWSPLWFKEQPFEALLKRIARTPSAYVRRLERMFDDEPWFGGRAPLSADFFVFEGLSAWCAILGAPYIDAIRNMPKLSKWWQRMRERVNVDALAHTPFTASPFEAELFTRASDFVRESGAPWPL